MRLPPADMVHSAVPDAVSSCVIGWAFRQVAKVATRHKIVVSLAAVLLVAVSTAIWWLPDADGVKAHVQAELERVTGREVSIGHLAWRWSPARSSARDAS